MATALLSPSAKQQFFDNAGAPAAGFKLHTYAAGTTNPQATFQDRAGTPANANPIILDARGEAIIYLTPGVMYDYALTTAAGVPVWTRANISADAGDADAVSFMQAGTGAAPRTTQEKLREIITVTDFYANGVSGARVDRTGTVDSTLGFQAALNAAAGGDLIVPAGAYKLTSALTIPITTRIIGAGMKNTYLFFTLPNASSQRLLSHNFGGTTIYGGGISDLSIIDQTTASGNTGIYNEDCLYFFVERCIIGGMQRGLHFNGCFQNQVRSCFIGDLGGTKSTAVGLFAENYSGVGIFDTIVTSDAGTPANQAGFGFIFQTGAAPTMHSAYTYGCRVGLKIIGNNGFTTYWSELTDCQFDTASDTGLQILAEPGGAVYGTTIENLWCATFGAYGVFIDHGGGSISGVTMNGGRIYANVQGGIVVQRASHVTIQGMHISGNGTVGTPQPGISITGAATHVSIKDNMIGQSMAYGNTQSYGILVGAVAADYLTITGNDVSGNTAGGGMAVFASGVNLSIWNNLGFDNSYGGAVASAATVALGSSQNNRVLGLTGTTTINTITPAYEGLTLSFVKADAGTINFSTAGNIAGAYSISPPDLIVLRYINGKFYKV